MIYASKVLAVLAAGLSMAQGITLWPQPVDTSIGGKSVALGETFALRYGGNSATLHKALGGYSDMLKGSQCVSTGDELDQCKIIVANENVPLAFGVDESYQIHVDGTDCTITAETVWGALHAVETFSQLVETDSASQCRKQIPSQVEISDYPRFSHRGILVDTARHYLPVADIHKIIDGMAQNKMNVFHWHLVDAQSFPFDAPNAPHAVEGAYLPSLIYSAEDMQSVVEYAANKGVRVMVEVDIPGHAASWGKGYPNVVANCPTRSANINNVPLNPAIQETYDVLGAVLGDIHSASIDSFTHLGGDEVIYSCWSEDASIVQWKNAQGYTSWDQVYCDFVAKADAMVRAAGRTPVHWEETFLTACDLPKDDTIIQVWIDQETIANVTNSGFKTIASPQEFWYLDHMDSTWDDMYLYEPTNGLTEAQQKNLIGGEACSWAETVDNTNVHTRIWPRAAAVAERLWSPITMTDKTAAQDRLTYHRCRMKARGIGSQPLGPGFCDTDGL